MKLKFEGTSNDLPTIYATKKELEELKALIGTGGVDLSEYVKKSDLPTNHVTTDILLEYAKTSQIPTKTSELTNDSGYLTTHQDLSSYALKSDIPDTSSFLTQADLQNAIETALGEIENESY